MDRRTFLAGAAGTVSVSLAGCLGAVVPSPVRKGDWDVAMKHNAFDPTKLTVSAGTTVTWKNTTQRAHTVTAYEDGIPDGASYFASGGFSNEHEARKEWADDLKGLIQVGETYEHTFTVPGTYNYFCIPHESHGMVGQVIVTEK